VKHVHGLFSPFISVLFSKSLTTGCFPREFKEAVVRPPLKNSELDATHASELQAGIQPTIPIQTVEEEEKVAQIRIQAFLTVIPKTQSACRRFHSIETTAT